MTTTAESLVVVKALKPSPLHSGLTPRKAVHLVYRLAIFLCAIFYVALCFLASYDATGLLRGRQNAQTLPEPTDFKLVTQALGSATIRESPLVKNALEDRPTPVNGTLYLTENGVSFNPCDNGDDTTSALFADDFLRSLYDAVTEGTAYHIPEIDPAALELIAPVVDCSAYVDLSSGRFFFLTRQRSEPQNVAMLVLTISNQQAMLPIAQEESPASVGVLQLVYDMRATDLTHHFVVSLRYPYKKFNFRAYDYVNTTDDGLWTLQSVPKHDRELSRLVETACRTGSYIKAESEQSNINNYVWLRETDAASAVGTLRWVSIPVLHDSWAWVHGVQFFIGMSILSDLSIVCLATYHNLRAGKWWIGDAFVAISSNQLLGAAAVLFSWFMNEFWSLHEFCFHEANVVSGFSSKIIYESHTRVDMLTIYLGACGLIGRLFSERITPLVAVACFFIGYEARVSIIDLFPSLRDDIIAYSGFDYDKGTNPPLPGQEKISPMRFWTTHPIGQRNYVFVAQCLVPIYSTLLFVLVYVGLRKLHRFFYPDKIHVQRNTTGTATSEKEQSLLSQKRVLTLFEVATGAELENRFGVVSDYETCVFIRGTKHASADGIYSNGFVIANQKFLLQTRDYWSIVLMKLLRRRFRNVYVYDVSGTTVQQTARLVYPHTLTLQDLLAINISVLA